MYLPNFSGASNSSQIAWHSGMLDLLTVVNKNCLHCLSRSKAGFSCSPNFVHSSLLACDRLYVYAGYWTVTPLPNAPQANTYSILAADRQGICAPYLSCQDCGGTLVDIYGVVSFPTVLTACPELQTY